MIFLSGISDGVFHIAGSVVCRTFGLVQLAFRLQLFIAGHFTGSILDRALRLVGCTLNMFTVHN